LGNFPIGKVITSFQDQCHSLILRQALEGIGDLEASFFDPQKVLRRWRIIGKVLPRLDLMIRIGPQELEPFFAA
jgi:hypothetical protein